MEPILAVDDIQGNVLGGFNKDFQALIHIAFGADIAAVKALIQTMSITTLSEVVTWRRAAAQIQETGRSATPPDALWTSVSLSWAGMAKLSPSAQGLLRRNVQIRHGPFVIVGPGRPDHPRAAGPMGGLASRRRQRDAGLACDYRCGWRGRSEHLACCHPCLYCSRRMQGSSSRHWPQSCHLF